MCGIFCSTFPRATSLPEEIGCRGPDHAAILNVDQIAFGASVLHLRGNFCPQPLQSDDAVFCFNGEIYNELPGFNPLIDNDTRFLFSRVYSCANGILPAQLFEGVQGPFAFALYDKRKRRLYFGRDAIGRRSLLYALRDGYLVVSSVASMDGLPWMETVPGHVYEYDIQARELRTEPGYETSACIKEGDDMIALLKSSVTRRLSFLGGINHPVNILFSGGIDSLLLACLAHEMAPIECPIQLINVAFENPSCVVEECPDRILGRRAYSELQTKFPARQWDFVKVDVCHQEYLRKAPYIYRLSFPQVTLRDLSIAAPLWFAASAVRQKVVLLGMGADELLGGYKRHRQAFHLGGWSRFEQELDLDFSRIGIRNLGRDDRLVGSHGIEARFPFLDEQFVTFVKNVRPMLKYDRISQIDKLPFRNILADHYGLADSLCSVQKRAIQFGSRSAKACRDQDGNRKYTLDEFLGSINFMDK